MDPKEKFVVPDDVYAAYHDIADRSGAKADKVDRDVQGLRRQVPRGARRDRPPNRWQASPGLEKALPTYKPSDDAVASRKLSETVPRQGC